jgi:hypothetical protein
VNPTPPTPDHLEPAGFEIGPSAISAYSRLNYTMWYALAEFVDNSTQSRLNYDRIIDDVLRSEGTPLRVEIDYDRSARTLTIRDNSIGMTREKLIAALRIARPTPDSKGRSKYGMGMKTAACWIGNKWTVTSCEWDSGTEWTAEIDVHRIVNGEPSVPLAQRAVDPSAHYTTITIFDLNRNIQKRTEETIMTYLGAMYRVDIRNNALVLLFNGNQVPLPETLPLATYPDGSAAREDFATTINGKRVSGWFGVLPHGGRKYGGFSIMQHDRQIRGFPDNWKPRAVFGGVEDEGSNTLVAQRLIGEIVLDDFEVSHTKDAILFRGTEEEELERFLAEKTRNVKRFALAMRTTERGQPWSREKVTELAESFKRELAAPETRDAIEDATLPPLSVIEATNRRQVESLQPSDELWTLEIANGITVRLYLQDRSENDPHLTISPGHDAGTLTVIINQQHPYYLEIQTSERADELIRQYVYDAVAEFRVHQRLAEQPPDAVRKLKDSLLRARVTRLHNQNAATAEQALSDLNQDLPPSASE